jgi:transcriptional regulator with XRE-family HTH domain
MARLRVRQIAEEQQISMSELSRRADVNITTVRRIWRDSHHNVSFHVLEKLALVLHVRVTGLIDDEQ